MHLPAAAQLVAREREDVASLFGKFMSFLRALVLVAVVGGSSGGYPAIAATHAELSTMKRRVALVEVLTLPDRMEDTRAQLHEVLVDAVQHHGFEVVTAGSHCGDASCLPEFASSAGATDVLVLRGGKAGSHGYHIDLSLWNALSQVASPAVIECTVCTGPQVVDAVGRAATSLLDQAPAPEARPLPSVAPLATPTSAPPILSPPPPVRAATVEDHRSRRVVGWSLFGLGVAASLGGGVVWSLDGKGADCVNSNCRARYHTQSEGIALVAGGIVGAGVGLWLGMESPGGQRVAFSVSPSGALIAGRY